MDIRSCSGVHVLHPKGDLTIFEAAEFRDGLLALHREEGTLELNLSEVERVDSSGIQLILAGMKAGRMSLTGVAPDLLDTCRAIGGAAFLPPSGTL